MRLPSLLKRTIQWLPGLFGMQLTRKGEFSFPDIEPQFIELYEQCRAFTMTSAERMYALYQATRYIANIPGDNVECSVWRGGSITLSASLLKSLGDVSRKFYLYDTYSGMSEPTAVDIDVQGQSALTTWMRAAHQADTSSDWCYASLDEVQRNVLSTGYPPEKFEFVSGKVEDTIPSIAPSSISLLRLDTDWYESSYHELKHLFPRLSNFGVLIIDDYGAWAGARQAVHQYFTEYNIRMFLHRIDDTGRIGIKLP